ncbi:SAM-dependent methyltransferase [Marinitoga sp. 1135]|uniref:Putative SAM-dependent methyltransferase n=1 Tax=Marinitoga piezophila (strain DSM 14283 / JCM 11233 / KA3) TaxID=443254 RepID=H2J3X2_MARPK|nr:MULTISPECIES: class I SAM-dependent rRNA methyltransferase [Marinitoga]AEX84700.1 putative SAM-dependent methyltransferase [Marinitoga piezophila KA3]APT75226.1 SAM-dependent methyltransferase [Marinitoga sp. 1137]NUU95005.1 SAM-dependent methyltransferase [Marinitoga sp. 1135]NUU96961.1 SAM-dependent methyltransferase [Marinitoga sp. 1138]
MANVYLKKGIKSRVVNGHPWIYENEINEIQGEYANGEIVNVFYNKNFIGKGYINDNSKIRVRLLTKKNEEIDKEWIKGKIKKAIDYRKMIFGNENTFRLIFGEGDYFPGLIVDKFNDYLVIQINTLGIYKLKNHIIDSLVELINPKGIFEKDDEKSAKIEEFEYTEGWIYKTGPELIPFEINGIKFFADTLGQKTGFFLDQRYNALKVKELAKDKNVLDGFSYTGNFGIHALSGGAKHVTFLDYSDRALFVLEKTLKENNISKDKYDLYETNTFDQLRKFDGANIYFDFVIIDPPSLAKSRSSIKNAIRGYKELNLRAMRITKNGSLFATASCTQLVYDEEFKRIIFDAAKDNKLLLRQIFKGNQSPDHPVVYNILETEYLKFYIFQLENMKL